MAEDIVLYVLGRTDLASLNPGKLAAQACHAANQAVFELKRDRPDLLAMLEEWENQSGDGFGTTIVLGMPVDEMQQAVESAKRLGLHAGVTHDPSYPLVDGATLHLIPLDTCAFVFAAKDEASLVLSHFNLMP